MAKFDKILVVGGGRSGWAVAGLLAANQHKVALYDQKPLQLPVELSAKKWTDNIEICDCDASKLNITDYSMVVLSPGVSIYHPLAMMAKEQNRPVNSELEIAWQAKPADYIAVTGTNGKTTVTSMIADIVKHANYKYVVGGNIGTALAGLVSDIDNTTVVVAEISSFQLEATHSFCPQVAVVLNLTPDHLDRHRTMDEYKACKEKVFARQNINQQLVLNYDDKVVWSMSERAQAKIWAFSLECEVDNGAWLSDGGLWLKSSDGVRKLMGADELQVKGRHNIANALAAAAATSSYGVKDSDIADALRSFASVEHRLEWCRKIDDCEFYNDSKATNPESTIVALEAFSDEIIWLAGGKDKLTDLRALMELAVLKTKQVIFYGQAAARFAEAARQAGINEIRCVDDLAEALSVAVSTKGNSVVLLSPACASYDQYDNYEQRGHHFKQLVAALTNK